MKYVKEIGIIFGISCIGELLNSLLPLPVPSGVYGLFILLAALMIGIIKLDYVESSGNWLLETMPLMFVPISVGLMESFHELSAILVPFVTISIISTLTVMAVTGIIAELIIKRKNKGEKEGEEE